MRRQAAPFFASKVTRAQSSRTVGFGYTMYDYRRRCMTARTLLPGCQIRMQNVRSFAPPYFHTASGRTDIKKSHLQTQVAFWSAPNMARTKFPHRRIWIHNVRLSAPLYDSAHSAAGLSDSDAECSLVRAAVFPYGEWANGHKKGTCFRKCLFGLRRIWQSCINRRCQNARYPVPRTSGRRGRARPAAE